MYHEFSSEERRDMAHLLIKLPGLLSWEPLHQIHLWPQSNVKSFHANGNQERAEYLYLYLTKYMLSQKQSQQTNKVFTNNKIVDSAEKYNNYECICSQHQRI